MSEEALYPIGIVCEQCGIKPVTLRAWERCHGLFVPHRTPKGHRLYTIEDINRIKKIQFLLSQGHAISKVKNLIGNAAKDNKSELTLSVNKQEPVIDFKRLESGVLHLNTRLIYEELGHLISEYGPENFAKRVYPNMLRSFNEDLWRKHSCPELGYQLLLDLCVDRLRNNILQVKINNKAVEIFIISYRSGMISKRIIDSLLIGNVLSAYGFKVTTVNNAQNTEQILTLALKNPSKLTVVSLTKDAFYQGFIVDSIERSKLKNICAYSTKWQLQSDCCLPEDLIDMFPSLKQRIQNL